MTENITSQEQYARQWRDSVLNGQTPQDFIVGRVDELRRFQAEAAKTDPKVAAEGPPGKYDFAYVIQMWIDQRVITEEEVGSCVNRLGLAPEEEQVFVSQTLPEIRDFMAEQRQKEAEEAQQRQKEAATKYCQEWGLERLDGIASYYQKNLSRLTPLNQYWGDGIKRYQNQRQRLEQELGQIADPAARAGRLMRELYYLTYFHPSEAEAVFRQEQEYNSYVYLDSLLEASQVMYKTTSGKDPDLSAIHFGAGGIGMTVTHYSIDDPESMKRKTRADTVESLTYGAKKPLETRALWKKQISPASLMQEMTPNIPASK